MMSLNAKMLRRDALRTAGIGLLAGALTGASTQAQERPSEQTLGFGPATTSFRGKLYAVWKGSGSDVGLSWYASSDGAEWSAPARIPKVASSAAPSLAVFDDKLYAAWKGANADQRLWHASFDGSQWSLAGANSRGSEQHRPGALRLQGQAPRHVDRFGQSQRVLLRLV